MVSWPLGIGKVIADYSKSKCLEIQYCEKQQYPLELWDSKWVKRFKTPIEAINYFWKHNPDKDYYYKKEKVIEVFLSKFPSEKKNLEQFLKNLKCTKAG